jgi:acyl dehydratase
MVLNEPATDASPAADVEVGDVLAGTTRTTGLAQWTRFAAVNDEFVDIHMDDEAGRRAGLPGAIGMGLLQVAYLHNTIRDWLGGRGRILLFSCRFTSPNLKGQTVSTGGRVLAVVQRNGRTEADLEVWTVDENGTTLVPGTCTVALEPVGGSPGPGIDQQ